MSIPRNPTYDTNEVAKIQFHMCHHTSENEKTKRKVMILLE